MNELNSTCNRKRQHERERRQIDSALITTTDFGFKKLRESILNEKINELKNSNIKNLNAESKGEHCFYFKTNYPFKK